MQTRDGNAARAALMLLLAINLFNFLDRQVLAAVESRIQETLFPADEYPRDPETRQPLDPTIAGKIGSLNAAFMFSYMLLAPIFGLFADRMRRWTLIGIGVMLWSLASGASGLAMTFEVLFLTRCLVGVGEAAYGPVAPAIIADLYPVSRRGSVLAWFYVAIPVGSALGYILGGQVTAWTGDWRWAFYVVVPPGLFLGVCCFFMPEPKRGQADVNADSDPSDKSPVASAESGQPLTTAAERPAKSPRWSDYLVILKTPSYLFNTLGMTAMTFAMGGMAFWMPRYVSQARDAGSLEHVNLAFGIIIVAAGLSATLLGGWAGDRLKTRFPGSYFLVSAAAMLLGFPMVLLTLWLPFPLAWVFVFLSCFCLFFNTGPTNTILANVTRPSVRASAFALNILIIHALGDAISPAIIGFINGYSGSMTVGFLAVSAMYLVAATCWLLGATHLEQDTRRASMADGKTRVAGAVE